jgi:osmotically-inducible protein OsmY
MKTSYFKSVVVTALLASGLASAFAAGTAEDAALAVTVKSAVVQSLGDQARDLAVTVDHGVVTLTGWAQEPRYEAQARAVASRVPGVTQAYSTVHTWSSGSDH